ncbi:MAG: heavy-metal-associated domain-containing protein [Micrococcales bacterium]
MSTHISLQISGMTCGHCEMSVGKELKNIGAENVVVSSATGTAEADFASPIDRAKLEEAVSEAGYQLVSVTNG